MIFFPALQAKAPAAWYGPVTATFKLMFAGNPYDPADNDVHVRFTGPKGDPIDRIAYFDGRGAWRAVLVTPIPGRYVAALYRNGTKVELPDEEGLLDAEKPLEYGYVRPDDQNRNRFRRDTGQLYYPIGFNLGWQGANFIPMKDQLAKMGAAGINWTRIWASSWDGKNPWFPSGDPKPIPGQLWGPALDKWQELEDACDADRVGFQMTLFNHGAFSSRVNPNWPDHPWNAMNGGFLKDAGDFFTDAEAKRRTRMWLRYAVARYGASPNLIAWELFNEVEWVDARYENRWPDICAWHREMADYLRSIDPYHHMITTSSEMGQPDLLAPLDYVQPHVYPANISAAIGGENLPKDKPGFFGEFGPGDSARVDPRRAVRDGIYSAMLANHAGTAMFWSWDVVESQNLYGEFATARKVADLAKIYEHPLARQEQVRVRTVGAADLSFAPAGGFEKAARTKLSLPDDLTAKALAGVPSYLQGNTHRDLFPEPLTLAFAAVSSGKVQIRIGRVARSGAHLHVLVNGQEAASRVYPPTDADHPGDMLEADYPAGSISLQISNDGSDWVSIAEIRLTNAGPQAHAEALGETDWLALRLTKVDGVTGDVDATIGGVSLPDGDYEVQEIDLATGSTTTVRRRVSDFQIKNVVVKSLDEVLVFKHL